MSYSRLIHEYLDTGLDEANEQTLFAELARDASLRMEFNKQVQLQMIAQNDMNSITPPVEVTSRIFGNLGFSIPAEEPVISNAGNTFFSKWRIAGLSLLATLILIPVTGYYYGWFDANETAYINTNSNTEVNGGIAFVSSEANDIESGNKDNTAENDLKSSEYGISKSIESSHSERSSISKFDGVVSGNVIIATEERLSNTAGRESYSGKNSSSNFGIADNEESTDYLTLQYYVYNSAGSNTIFDPYGIFGKKENFRHGIVQNSIENQGSSRLPVYPGFSSYNFNEYIDPTDWSITIRGVAPAVNLATTSYNKDFSVGNNLAVGFLYKIDKYNGFFVEIAKEDFAQDYSRIINGVLHNREQIPSMLVYGAGYRLIVPEWAFLDVFAPYTRFSINGTTIGPMLKAQPGFTIKVGQNASLMAGLEYSLLYYNYNTNIYNTQKLGLTAGFGIDF